MCFVFLFLYLILICRVFPGVFLSYFSLFCSGVGLWPCFGPERFSPILSALSFIPTDAEHFRSSNLMNSGFELATCAKE